MASGRAFFRWSELDRTSFPEFRDRILEREAEESLPAARSYPGYPRWPLVQSRPRAWNGLDQALRKRRCHRHLDTALPPCKVLSRLLQFAHGVTASEQRGPVPSAGGLQALELYLVNLTPSWLPAGLYHYDRAGHHLSRIAAGAERTAWQDRVPALGLVTGGALLWVLVGDGERVAARYGDRGCRFLLLEAGNLMQNLCLLSSSLGLATVPLGGYFEQEVAQEFVLPATDWVLYLGVCGGAKG